MKKSKNEVEFVELKTCFGWFCERKTDVFCVSCKKWFCSDHIQDCVQCEQPVCKECLLGDLCCLVRPRGKKTEEHLKKFYENKLVDAEGMNVLAEHMVLYDDEEVRETKCKEIRKDVMKRSVEFFVDNFDVSFARKMIFEDIFAKVFPRITKYIENEEKRLKFVDFMKNIAESNSRFFAKVLFYSDDRDELISMTEELIREDGDVLMDMIKSSLRENGKPLFDGLKNRGLLDLCSKSELTYKEDYAVGHIDGMKWIESNGIDVVNDEEHFKRFARYASKEVKEYLASKGGKMIEYLMSDDFVFSKKFQGNIQVQRIESSRKY